MKTKKLIEDKIVVEILSKSELLLTEFLDVLGFWQVSPDKEPELYLNEDASYMVTIAGNKLKLTENIDLDESVEKEIEIPKNIFEAIDKAHIFYFNDDELDDEEKRDLFDDYQNLIHKKQYLNKYINMSDRDLAKALHSIKGGQSYEEDMRGSELLQELGQRYFNQLCTLKGFK